MPGRDRRMRLPGRLRTRSRQRIPSKAMSRVAMPHTSQPVPSPLLPNGFTLPASRFVHPSTRMRELLATEPFLFGPGVYDPMGAELVMYYGFKAVYFSGFSFAIGHLGTTDMDLYSSVEIADAARRTVSALRKFQLTMAVGEPEKGVAPRHLDLPPVIVDMDGGYGNIFNVHRTTELYVTAAGRRRPPPHQRRAPRAAHPS